MRVLGDRLKELRGERSQNQIIKEFIEQTNTTLTSQTLGRYENGNRNPDSEMITALADYYGVSADYLLGRTDIKTADKDLQFVCEYTGLSEEAVENLKSLKWLSNPISLFIAAPELWRFIQLYAGYLKMALEEVKCICIDKEVPNQAVNFEIGDVPFQLDSEILLNMQMQKVLEQIVDDGCGIISRELLKGNPTEEEYLERYERLKKEL